MEADAIVVGAGPAGSSTAYHLARRGRRVLLLERSRFPRDKSCGDGLTRFATRQLAEMGVLDDLLAAPVTRGARIRMRGRAFRDFRYPDRGPAQIEAMVVPRVVLDHAVCSRAQGAGADLWPDTLVSKLVHSDDGVVIGVRVRRDGEERVLHAPVVVAADGASSRLGRQAGLVVTPPEGMGYAIRGYYEGIDGLQDLLEIFMPLLDPTDRYLLPSYGWVFPVGPDKANIGVGLVHRERGANVRELLGRFLDELRADPRFRGARPCGDWRGAPLRFDFLPERCAGPGIVLVGDAAGMISPFTGEGIGYALTSGRLAAETIDAALNLTDGAGLDLSGYPAALARRFTGYFEAGRESARRYKLIWHVLESTFENEKPLFNICRRAALFPEGLGESYIRQAFDDVGPALATAEDGAGEPSPDRESSRSELASVRSDLLAIGQILIGTVRSNWPFLARVVSVDETVPGVPLRPALLLLLAGRVASIRRSILVSVGAAVEMGYVAALAHASVGDDGPQTASRNGAVNWGNRFALMVGDFLLSHAYGTSAAVAADVSREFAAAVTKASEGYVLGLRNAFNPDLTPEEYLGILEQKAGTLFELPCRLGARISDASPQVVAALGAYGRNLGVAYQLIEDLLAAAGAPSELGRAIGADPAAGLYSYSIVHALQGSSRDRARRVLSDLRSGSADLGPVLSLTVETGSVQAAIAHAERRIVAANAAVRRLPDGKTRRWLLGIADFVSGRVADVALAGSFPPMTTNTAR